MRTVHEPATSLPVAARVSVRLLAVAGLLAAYYALDWMWFCGLTRDALLICVRLAGRDAYALDGAGGMTALVCSGDLFRVTPNCTYAAVMAILAPLLWRYQRSVRRNIAHLLVLAAGMSLVNVVRLALAVSLYQQGGEWRTVHDIPDAVIQVLVIVVFTVRAARVDFDLPAPVVIRRPQQGLPQVG